MVQNQMIYKLKNEFLPSSTKTKNVERSILLKVTFKDKVSNKEFFSPDYEFWSQDEFSVLKDILDSQSRPDNGTLELHLSGTFAQIRSYTRIIKRVQKHEQFEAEIIKDNQNNTKAFAHKILDSELLELIKTKLPDQPWRTGIHKEIASEIEVSNKLVSIAIQQLIAKGDFKQQIDGQIIEDER